MCEWVRRKEKSASKREQKQSTFDYAECEQIQDDKVGLKEKAEIRKEKGDLRSLMSEGE